MCLAKYRVRQARYGEESSWVYNFGLEQKNINNVVVKTGNERVL
jgi:hypothetical protein